MEKNAVNEIVNALSKKEKFLKMKPATGLGFRK